MSNTGTAVAQLLNAEARTAAVQADQARTDYVALLVADSGQQADIDALAVAAKRIGKTANEVMADARAVKDAKAHIAKMQSLAGCGYARQRIADYHTRHRKLIDDSIRRLEEQSRTLYAAQGDAAGRVSEFEGAARRLAELKSGSFGPLLASLAMPDALLADATTTTPEAQVTSFAAWLAARVAMTAAPLADSNTPLPAVP